MASDQEAACERVLSANLNPGSRLGEISRCQERGAPGIRLGLARWYRQPIAGRRGEAYASSYCVLTFC